MSGKDTEFFDTSKSRMILAIVVFTLCTIIPAMGYSGFIFKELIGLDPLILYGLSAGGGLLAFFITNFKRILPNLIAGPITGAGITFASIFYLSNRESIIKIELIIPLILGAIPGVLIYYLMTRRLD